MDVRAAPLSELIARNIVGDLRAVARAADSHAAMTAELEDEQAFEEIALAVRRIADGIEKALENFKSGKRCWQLLSSGTSSLSLAPFTTKDTNCPA